MLQKCCLHLGRLQQARSQLVFLYSAAHAMHSELVLLLAYLRAAFFCTYY